jgi:hypothetical protein
MYRGNRHPPMIRSAGRRTAQGLLGWALVLTGLAAGCGAKSGGSQHGDGLDTTALLKQLRNVKKGEILIIGQKPVRFSGPYSFRGGRYVFRFTQRGGEASVRPHLRVSLESRRGSRQKPYQLVVDTDRVRGQAPVRISGRLFVHVVTSSPSYLLRFTPLSDRR